MVYAGLSSVAFFVLLLVFGFPSGLWDVHFVLWYQSTLFFFWGEFLKCLLCVMLFASIGTLLLAAVVPLNNWVNDDIRRARAINPLAGTELQPFQGPFEDELSLVCGLGFLGVAIVLIFRYLLLLLPLASVGWNIILYAIIAVISVIAGVAVIILHLYFLLKDGGSKYFSGK